MRKFFLFCFSCLAIAAFAIDWNSLPWLANGSGDAKNDNKYKVSPAFGQTVINIQQPAWATEAGIYTNFPAAIESCTGLAEGKYKIEGAGVILYLSGFTKKETSLSVAAGGVDYDFTVFYADGEGEVNTDPENPDPDPEKPDNPGDKLTPATYNNSSEVEIAGVKVQFAWSITRNADKTLTFEISWNQDIEGVVPQICINDAFSTMPYEGKTAKFTTKETFNDGEALNAFFYIAYTGNAAKIEITGYKIGDSNTKPSDPEDPDPEDPNNPDNPDPENPDNQGLEEAQSIGNGVQKTIIDGQLVIIRNGVRYSAAGEILR